MLDSVIRRKIDPPLNRAGRVLASAGISATQITAAGAFLAVVAATSITLQAYTVALALIVLNRLLDGLDGAVARATAPTDLGGYLDTVSDYLFYAGIPLGFAFADPERNALAAAALLAGFCLTCSGFLTFAILASRRGLETDAQGKKSFFYSRGLVEGTETIAFFLLMSAFPRWFPVLAWTFGVLCVLTGVQRTVLAVRVFR